MKDPKRLSPKKYNTATVVAYLIIPISGFATDVYLPSMPKMALGLHLSEGRVQLTLTLFLVSYGLSQLISGAFLDSFGRYRISLSALLVFSFSCLVTAWSDSIALIYLMRIIQGLAVGFIVVATRAFFTDIYEGEKKKNMISLMTIVWSAGPIVAPFVGGYLEHSFGWRSNFYGLAVFGFFLFVMESFFSGETIKQRIPLDLSAIVKSYRTILSARDFVFGIMMLGIAYAMIMFFSLSGPFIIEHKMNFSPVVAGNVSLLLGIAWMCGGFVGKGLIRRSFLPKNRNAYAVQILLIGGMIAGSFFLSNLWTLAAFAFLIHITAGFIFNNYFTYCLARFPQAAGIAGGLAGGLAYTFTSLLSYGTVAAIRPASQLDVGVGYLALAVLGMVVLWFSRKTYDSPGALK